MTCLSGTMMTMVATVLRQARTGQEIITPDTSTPTPETGHFETLVDDVTGDISSVWVAEGDSDNEIITDDEGNVVEFTIPCRARAFTDTGYRSASNTEEFDRGIYRVYEYVELRFPPNFTLTRRDVVTAIRDSATGKALWVEEEASLSKPDVYPATDFDVIGVNPIFDPFGTHVENVTVLKRAATQSGQD